MVNEKYTLRMRLSNRLHLWAARIHDDFHSMTLTHSDGTQVRLSCYWQWTGSWPEEYAFDCDCEE